MDKSMIIILVCIIHLSFAAYSPPQALFLGYMSKVAYESAASINAWTCGPCQKYKLEQVSVFQNSTGNIQGFTGYHKSQNEIIVAFRGSSDIKNWILNIDATYSDYPCSGCKVHAGFYSGYNMVKSEMLSKVHALANKYKTAKVYVTGHSLGGALAIFGALDIKKQIQHTDLVETFGQPRVGNSQFDQYYRQNIYSTFRLIDYADIVPHLPPANFGFYHTGEQVWYQRGMQSYQLCAPESSSCANSLSVISYSTDDHSLDNYLKLKINMSLFEQITSIFKNSLDIFIKQHLHLRIDDIENYGFSSKQPEISSQKIQFTEEQWKQVLQKFQ